MSPRPLAFTDEQFLAAAAAAIADVGPARLTLAEVAGRVGAAPATLVKRFGSKHGLLVALAAHGAASIEASIGRPADDRPALDQLVERIAGLGAGILHSEMAHHVAFLQLDVADEELRRHAAAFARQLTVGVRRYLTAAHRRGELSCPDLTRLARAVVTTYNGVMITWALDGAGTLPHRLTDEVDFLLTPYRTG
ncbi:TetR/AcrR family transcriptional regulator [Actinocatenispora rupis]|uniref:HTH tetR-type domain-containing protein n=1 Tax=Actinocatenispora rupis TaxID=519421 RepID=A0A8J3NE63_9ACTN|nr:TetR family transcriptional regulator [Actinocatenispora rupis]GID12239.1 hypothetical protein Aru02nite_31280 [Actinocatenispora rupis]